MSCLCVLGTLNNWRYGRVRGGLSLFLLAYAVKMTVFQIKDINMFHFFSQIDCGNMLELSLGGSIVYPQSMF